VKGAVAWYGPPARPYQGASGPVTGFDLAKDIHTQFLGLYGETEQNPKPEDAKAAAQDAWKRCTDFFAKNLKA
jgi:dienelactone hydrolase